MPRREFNLADLNGLNGFSVNGVSAGDWSGRSVEIAGDLNADGVDDIIVGAFLADPNGRDQAGESYIVFGRHNAWSMSVELSSLNGTNGVKIEGAAIGIRSGISVSAAGDINDDGIDDVIIGALGAAPGGRIGAGESYVIFGHYGEWPDKILLSALNGTLGFVIQGAGPRDQSGWDVSNAGDVNNDGIADIVVAAREGSPNNRTNAGAVYVIFGRRNNWPEIIALSSLSGRDGFEIQGKNTGDWSGYSVSSLGDINCDGIDDLIIGAINADPEGRENAGETYVLFGWYNWTSSFMLSRLDGSNGFTIQGVHANDRSGFSVSSAGDLNNDNITDIVISTYYSDPSRLPGSGLAYVIFGHCDTWPPVLPLSSLNGTNGFVIEGFDIGEVSGSIVSSVNDVNNDHIDDIAIGIGGSDPSGRSNAGEIYVLFGHKGPWLETISLISFFDSGVILAGINPYDRSGVSLSSADLNADGVSDIVIGAYNSTFNGRENAGQSYLIFGGAEQFTANQIIIESGEMIRLTQDNIAVYPIIGSRTFTVNNASHINFIFTYNTSNPISNFTQQQVIDGEILVIHDGSRDVPSYTLSAEGITRIFSDVHPQEGNISFSLGAPRISAPNGEFNLSSLDGLNGLAFQGVRVGAQTGQSSADLGDVNGDEIDDIILGASGIDESYVIFGRRGAWEPKINLSFLNGTNGFVLQGGPGEGVGISLSSAGDINQDGYNDIIIGSRFSSSYGKISSGKVYVIFGANRPWHPRIFLSSLNGLDGFIVHGMNVNDRCGEAVSGGSDLNGDGIDDFIVTSEYANARGLFNSGESYVIFGANQSWSSNFNLSSLDGMNGFSMPGEYPDDLSGYSASVAGDINNDGIGDFIIGVPFASVGSQIHAGKAYIIFGRTDGFSSSFLFSSLNGSNGFIFDGISLYGNTAVSVSKAGDINADGIEDFIIGERSSRGEIHIIFGKRDGWLAYFNTTSLTGVNGFVLKNDGADDSAGRSVSNAGDINGDGIDDLLVGAWRANPNSIINAGRSYVIFGRKTVWPALISLNSMDASVGISLEGIHPEDQNGWSLSSARDFNGDGFDDIILTSRGADPNAQDNAGECYLIFGGSEQFNRNQIEIRQGEILRLNASNIAVEPNIESRIIHVTNVEHGRFALRANQTIAINTFTQGQINNGEIVFIHDGSDQAPSYVASAQGITRVFSNVHPLSGNVSFILSTSTLTTASTLTSTNTETSTSVSTSSTVSTVTDTNTITSITTTTTLSKTFITSTWLSLLTTHLPLTTDLNAGTKNADLNTEDSGSNILEIAVGILSSLLVLALLWILHSRHKNQKNNQLQNIANPVRLNGREHGTVEMMMNPMHVQSEALVTGEGYPNKQSDLATGYLDVAGANDPSSSESTTDEALTAGEYLEPVSISDSTILSGQLHTYLSPVLLRKGDKEQPSSISSKAYAVPIFEGMGEDHCYSELSDSSGTQNTDIEKSPSNVYRLFKNESIQQINTQQQYSMN